MQDAHSSRSLPESTTHFRFIRDLLDLFVFQSGSIEYLCEPKNRPWSPLLADLLKTTKTFGAATPGRRIAYLSLYFDPCQKTGFTGYNRLHVMSRLG